MRSATDGRFYPSDPHELKGKWLRQGDVIGFVIKPSRPTIRAVVAQDAIGLLRENETTAEVMLADGLGKSMHARIVREVPAGSRELPSMALGAAGGGKIAVDMNDTGGRTAAREVFQIELVLPSNAVVAGIGERAYVRLQHGSESLWEQWSRSIRQLLLSRLQT